MATINYQENDTAQVCSLAVYCSSVSGTVEVGRQAEQGVGAGSSENTFSVPTSQADDAEYSFELVIASDSTWDAGNWTVRLDLTTGANDATWESCFICRVNSGCTNQAEIGSATGLGISCMTAGVKSTVIAGSVQSPSAGDKVIIVCGFSNSNSMFARTLGITPSQLIDSPFNPPAGVGQGAGLAQVRFHAVIS